MWPLNDPNYLRRLRMVNRVRLLIGGSLGMLLCILLLAFPDVTPGSPAVAYGFGAFGIVVFCTGLWSIRKNQWRIREPNPGDSKIR